MFSRSLNIFCQSIPTVPHFDDVVRLWPFEVLHIGFFCAPLGLAEGPTTRGSAGLDNLAQRLLVGDDYLAATKSQRAMRLPVLQVLVDGLSRESHEPRQLFLRYLQLDST